MEAGIAVLYRRRDELPEHKIRQLVFYKDSYSDEEDTKAKIPNNSAKASRAHLPSSIHEVDRFLTAMPCVSTCCDFQD